MPAVTRRNALHAGIALALPPTIVTLITGCGQSTSDLARPSESPIELESDGPHSGSPTAEEPMKIQYLEIVTPEVDALCRQYSKIYSVTFSEPNSSFGGARTAKLDGGGLIGIRGPLRDTETPVVRPYVLVDDIEAAVASAAEAGAEIAMPPMEIPEHGLFAIVIHGGIDCGFWQL